MSNTAKDVKLSLRVMLNKEETKVFFAEAGIDFADVLLSFLTLPLGRIVKLLERHYADNAPAFGSITSLYKSIANLDDAHFSTTAAKQMLLDPRSSFDSICRKLKLDISNSAPIKYFSCTCNPLMCAESRNQNISMYYGGSVRCSCGNPLNEELFVQGSDYGFEDAGLFTAKMASFIICDDLQIVPYDKGFFRTLSNLGITCDDITELRNVTFGSNEIMDLLKCSLFSKTPLSDLVLKKGGINSFPSKSELFFHQIKKDETRYSMPIKLKIMVQKSTKKLLFVQAKNDFIELLCSFLIIPIAGVESILVNNTCLRNLDNLYRSFSDFTFVPSYYIFDIRVRLMNPNIPHFYKSKNTFLPLKEESAPVLYYRTHPGPPKEVIYSYRQFNRFDWKVTFKSPKGEGYYVKAPSTYMVTDDLTVTPCCMSSILSFLDHLNIPLSDVDELEVPILLEEALSILKASLTSKSPLTTVLMNRLMTKKPKQEH